MSRWNIAVAAAATIFIAAAARAQPTTGEQDMAAKANCSDFKSSPDGTWTGKDGKKFAKHDHMAIALEQKCGAGKK